MVSLRIAVVSAVAFLTIGGESTALAAPKTVEVVIEHFAFTPALVEVTPGDMVVFVNRDITPHTATATDGSWTTKDVVSGKSEAVVVPAKGDGAFFCKYHPVMKGRLVIRQ